MYPLTTTAARIDACNPCDNRRNQAARLLGITEPNDDPISYEKLLDTLGLDDALWCCRAEPHLAAIWRRYAVWCARQVQGLMTDQRSLDALNVADRHANGQATDQELAAALDAARDAADAAALASWAAALAAALAAARDAAWAADAAARDAARAAADAAADAAWAARRAAARQQQADAFRQLVTTGTLPH
jgi:hypothetical protein